MLKSWMNAIRRRGRREATQQKSPEAKKFEEKAGALAQKVFRREEDREIQCRFEQAFRSYGIKIAIGSNREGRLYTFKILGYT